MNGRHEQGTGAPTRDWSVARLDRFPVTATGPFQDCQRAPSWPSPAGSSYLLKSDAGRLWLRLVVVVKRVSRYLRGCRHCLPDGLSSDTTDVQRGQRSRDTAQESRGSMVRYAHTKPHAMLCFHRQQGAPTTCSKTGGAGERRVRSAVQAGCDDRHRLNRDPGHPVDHVRRRTGLRIHNERDSLGLLLVAGERSAD